MDATNQTSKSLVLTKIRYSATQKGNCGDHLNAYPPVALMRSRASQVCSDKHDGCLSAASLPLCPSGLRSAGNPQDEHGLAFFGSFFGHAKYEQWALVRSHYSISLNVDTVKLPNNESF